MYVDPHRRHILSETYVSDRHRDHDKNRGYDPSSRVCAKSHAWTLLRRSMIEACAITLRGPPAISEMRLNSCPIGYLDPAKQDHTATWAMGSRKITGGNRLSDPNRSSQVASNGAGVSSCFRFRVGVSGPIFSLRLRLRNMCHII